MDDQEELGGGALGAIAALSPMEASGPLSREALLGEARQFVDPKAKYRAAAAGALKPGASFAEAYGSALSAYNAGADREAELTARYMPIVQRAALERRKAQLEAEARARTTLDTYGASALTDPMLTPQKFAEGLKGLVQQNQVPGQMAEAYLKALPTDPEGLRKSLMQRSIAVSDPYRATKIPTVEKYGEGEIGYSVDPVTGKRTKVAEGGTKSGEFSRTLGELMSMDPSDPRRPMLEKYLQKLMTHPPSSSMVVNAEKPLIGSFMTALGTSAGAQRDTAVGAKNSLQTANRLLYSLSQPGIIAGPTADAEIVIRQLAEFGNYGGKDNRERLANTRAAIQAMAQLELDAAAQMKGQGAITEGERALLAKAASGNIRMTVPELRTLAEIVRKTAQYRIKNYNAYAKRLAELPGLEKVAPLLTVDDDETGGLELKFDDQGRPVK